MTMNRDRFDYARILVSTTLLEIIRTEASVMIDGVRFDFQIIEEWGCALGEGACLLDDEEVKEEDFHECPEIHVDVVGHGDVDAIVDQLTADWEAEVCK